MKKTKAQWPHGVWNDEPDDKRWEDRCTGLQCVALRGPTGAWCGYVGVADGHPAYGFNYSVLYYSIEDVASGIDKATVSVQVQINDIKVHGGLSFTGSDETRGTDKWWFGFDCSNAGDFMPAYDDIAKLGRPTGWGDVETYRTLSFVESECASLADQLAAIRVPK